MSIAINDDLTKKGLLILRDFVKDVSVPNPSINNICGAYHVDACVD